MMGLIFDINSAELYTSWYQSHMGRAVEKSSEELILALLDPRPGQRVLDIGCGTGDNLIFFNKLGLDINGVDASPYMISRARERLGNRCSLKIGRAEDLPFDDNEFDLAVLINTLEFLDDPLQALREAGRVASGRVFIGVLNSLSWHCLFGKTKGLFRESLLSHVRFYNIWELKSYVQMVFGRAPMTWKCVQTWPPYIEKIERFLTDLWHLKHCPFGLFLGLEVTPVYRVKTDNLPLKIRLKKTKQSIADGVGVENITLANGDRGDERGLFI